MSTPPPPPPGADETFEAVARMIDPGTWRVLDSYLADVKRKYRGQDAGYDPEAFRDKKSLKLAREIVDFLASRQPSPPPTASDDFQTRVRAWVLECFGDIVSCDVLERCDRFIEEAIELVQALDYPSERIAALTSYTYAKPKGEPFQEAGGVMMTIGALCGAVAVNMHDAGEAELARCWTKVDIIRAKQAAKPTGSALPVAPPPTASEANGALVDEWRDYSGHQRHDMAIDGKKRPGDASLLGAFDISDRLASALTLADLAVRRQAKTIADLLAINAELGGASDA